MQRHNTASHQTDLLSELFGEAISSEITRAKEEEIYFKEGDQLDGSYLGPWMKVERLPKATPRPRARAMKQWKNGEPYYTAQVYNDPNYTAWKEELSKELIELDFVKSDYNGIDLVLGIPIPKSYTKKFKQENEYALHTNKPDFDNFIKGVLDAIQLADKIENDSKLGSGLTEKIWIEEESNGFILFRLKKLKKSIVPVKSVLDLFNQKLDIV